MGLSRGQERRRDKSVREFSAVKSACPVYTKKLNIFHYRYSYKQCVVKSACFGLSACHGELLNRGTPCIIATVLTAVVSVLHTGYVLFGEVQVSRVYWEYNVHL